MQRYLGSVQDYVKEEDIIAIAKDAAEEILEFEPEPETELTAETELSVDLKEFIATQYQIYFNGRRVQIEVDEENGQEHKWALADKWLHRYHTTCGGELGEMPHMNR